MKAHITIKDYMIAESNGISKDIVRGRIRNHGWSKERALTEKPKTRGERLKWAFIADKNGIGRSTFYSRINKQGYSLEEAATRPVRGRK